MNPTQPTWIEPLRKLLVEVRSPQPGKDGFKQMMSSLAELESLLARNRDEMTPQLVHFLERRSYEKAAQLCAGDAAITPGTCGTRN